MTSELPSTAVIALIRDTRHRMGPDASDSLSQARKRSRNGCYTCRFRKVKCEVNGEPQQPGKENLSKCDNCNRLGFQCRWNSPASGERYVPPPKRRRTTRNKRGGGGNQLDALDLNGPSSRASEDRNEKQGHNPVGSESSRVRSSEIDAGAPAAADFRGQNHYQLGFLDTLTTESDISIGYDIFDLNLAGEGLDFVPLPSIEQKSQTGALADSARAEWSEIIPILDMSQLAANVPASNENISINTDSSSSPFINEDNRRLIRHYLDVMKGFAKVEDYSRDANNLFISAFSESLCFPPLFYAILCFSASHLGMQDQSYLESARCYDQLAKESFEAFARGSVSQTDGLLSALFVRVKTIHITGGSVEVFLDLMAKASHIISSTFGLSEAKEPSTLTKRIIIRLAMLDARAAYYRLGGGGLVRSLKEIPALAFIFDGKAETENSQRAILDLLRGTILRMRVAELDIRLHEQMDAEVVSAWPLRTEAFTSLYAEIKEEIDKWEQKAGKNMARISRDDFAQDEVIDPSRFNYGIVLCALHSALLYLHTVFPLPSIDFETSVSKILESQLKLRHDPSRLRSPSSILPSSLFLAGVCTMDPIRQDWVLQILKSCEQESIYVRKTRELLEAIFRLRLTDSRVDICDVMQKSTGKFII